MGNEIPSLKMPMLVQISATSDKMWEEKKMVLPMFFSSRSSSRISMRARGSRPLAGSSRMRSLRIVGEGAGQAEALLHAPAEALHVGIFFVAQIYQGQQIVNHACRVAAGMS
jgi:hypothetical protein